ncbi:MAG: SpoIIE family protein phosphatase [Anaerolineae bacterium]|nr:SpoIIE family protein phosphatase [Anaerolineae bacterium]
MNNPPRILIVDDEPFNVDYLEQELADFEYELLTAVNGEDALKKINADSPDLVLLDIMMPVMDGFSVLEQTKSNPVTRGIPVIIISANNDLKSVVKGIQMGADDYLPKPFEPTILHARINASLERKRLRDQEQLYLQSLENELNIARDIQKEFLPEELPQITGWQISSYFKAAKEVAGDFYDAFLLPDGNFAFVVADVCGKGIGAALYMTLFRSLIRASASSPDLVSPAQRLQHAVALTNNYVAEVHESSSMFATIFIGILESNSGKLTYINGGNEPALIVNNGMVTAELTRTGPAIGAIPLTVFRVNEFTLSTGDMLIAFTDGIPDTQNSTGDFFGKDKMMAVLETGKPTPAGFTNEIEETLRTFIGTADPFDDITLLAIMRE